MQHARVFGVVRHPILEVLGSHCIVKHNVKMGEFYEADRETDQGYSKASACICP